MVSNASPISLASYSAAVTPLPPATTPPLFGGQIGPDTSGLFALSINGLAVQRGDGRWVAKSTDEPRLFDVTDFLLSGIDPMVYYVPVDSLEPGDLTVVSNDPLTLRYVISCGDDGEMEVLDPDTGDVTEFVALQTPLFDFFIKVVSLADFLPDLGVLGGSDWSARFSGLPFGRRREQGEGMRDRRQRMETDDLLLYLLLSQQQGTSANNLLPLLLLSQCGPDSGMLALLALSGGFPQIASTAPVSPAPVLPTGAAPAPPANNALLLALLLGGGGFGMRRRERDNDAARSEAPRDKRPEKREDGK